jgi:DASS family divalent anion:Na+ symporter
MMFKRRQLIGLCVALAAGLIVWFAPTPAGLSLMGQRSLAILLTALLLVLLRPIPGGPAVLAALVAAALLGVTGGKKAVDAVFSGFSCSAFWIITSAFVITIAIVRSGLGQRIAYALISKVGGSSLGMGYALTFSNYAISPATPAITARGAGIALPVARSVCTVFKWRPNFSKYICLTSLMATHTTALGFMTASASGPIVAALASSVLGVEVSWVAWVIAALPATLTLLLLQPWLIHRLYPPEPALRKISRAKKMAKIRLQEIGPFSRHEKITVAVFGLVIALWATELWHHIDAAIVGLLGMVILMLTTVLKMEDLRDINFNILFALAGLYSLSSIVAASGGFGWIAQTIAGSLSGLPPAIFMALFGVLLCYLHAPFMVTSAMALSIVPPMFTIALAAGASLTVIALLSGILVNGCAHFVPFHTINWAFYETGTFKTSEVLKLGLLLSTLAMLLVLVSVPFWGLIGI